MSENSSLNSADGAPPNTQQTLSKLEPEPLAVNRDELFFQAGYAAGSSNQTTRFFWPSAAAALLILSISMAAALAHHIIRSDSAPGQAVAVNQATGQRFGERLPTTAQQSMATDSRSQLWQRLASSTTLPRGQLTAIGWSELPERMGSGQPVVGGEESGAGSQDREPPRLPSTYLELMRAQNKG